MNWLAAFSVGFVILIGIIVIVELIAVTALLLVLKNLVQEIREHLDPLISKANTLLAKANEMAETVQDRTEHIAEKTAETTDTISNRMEKTTDLMQRAVSNPIIGGIAAADGIRRGFNTWRALRKQRRERAEKKRSKQ